MKRTRLKSVLGSALGSVLGSVLGIVFLAAVLALPGSASLAAGQADTVWIPGWRQTAPLQTPRAGAAVVAAGEYLYVIGGIDGRDFLRSVEYTRFRPDGTLEPWQTAPALQEARGFFGAVTHDGYLYVAGGANGPGGKNLLRSVERARLLPDGGLGPWERLPGQLSLPRRCIKLSVAGGRLYALGGFSGTLLDTVESAPFLPDGGLGTWTMAEDRLTLPRYVNAVQNSGEAVYLLGGHRETEGTGLQAVEYARIRGNSLAPWQRTASLQQGRYALAAALHGDYLYALGGLDGAIYTDRIEKARIREDLGLDGWRTTTSLSSPRANFAVVVRNGFIYVIGGTNRDGYYRSVEYARFDSRGDIGFRGTPAEAAAYEAARQERGIRRRPLPNAGIITRVIQTRSYSYLEVETAGRRTWLAAPRGDFSTGQHIRYSRGVAMQNFHSRALNRAFAEILFVERAEPLEQDVP